MVELRRAIRAGERRECERCVCSMYRRTRCASSPGSAVCRGRRMPASELATRLLGSREQGGLRRALGRLLGAVQSRQRTRIDTIVGGSSTCTAVRSDPAFGIQSARAAHRRVLRRSHRRHRLGADGRRARHGHGIRRVRGVRRASRTPRGGGRHQSRGGALRRAECAPESARRIESSAGMATSSSRWATSVSTSSSSIRRSSLGAPANERDCAWRSTRRRQRVSPPVSRRHLTRAGAPIYCCRPSATPARCSSRSSNAAGIRAVGARGAALHQRARHHSRRCAGRRRSRTHERSAPHAARSTRRSLRAGARVFRCRS